MGYDARIIESGVYYLFALFILPILTLIPVSVVAGETVPTYDLGIESMRSHGYSVAIFAFMMLAIAVFVGIIWAFFTSSQGESIKTGEKILFGMIVLGVIAASIFAAVQLLDGVLF